MTVLYTVVFTAPSTGQAHGKNLLNKQKKKLIWKVSLEHYLQEVKLNTTIIRSGKFYRRPTQKTEQPQVWTTSKENAVKETFKSDLFTIIKPGYLRHNHLKIYILYWFKADAATICLLLLLPLCENLFLSLWLLLNMYHFCTKQSVSVTFVDADPDGRQQL